VEESIELRGRNPIVLAGAGRDDWILYQVTSNPYSDHQAIMLSPMSFTTGSLPVTSHARPGKLFTANTELKLDPFKQIIEAVVAMLRAGVTV